MHILTLLYDVFISGCWANRCTVFHFWNQAYLTFFTIRDRGLFPTSGVDHSCMHWDSLRDNLRKKHELLTTGTKSFA